MAISQQQADSITRNRYVLPDSLLSLQLSRGAPFLNA